MGRCTGGRISLSGFLFDTLRQEIVIHWRRILKAVRSCFLVKYGFRKMGALSSSISSLMWWTTFNQASKLMLRWTFQHQAITICWGGCFYNWGENSNSGHSTRRYQSAEVKCLNFFHETGRWHLKRRPNDNACACNLMSPSESKWCRAPWIFPFNGLTLNTGSELLCTVIDESPYILSV